MHWARDCPMPRPARAAPAAHDRRPPMGGAGGPGGAPGARRPPPPAPQRDFRARRCHPDAPSDGVVAYGGTDVLPFCLDTGANASFISAAHALLIHSANPDTSRFVDLQTPVPISQGGTQQLESTRQLVCDFPLTLRSRSGLEHSISVALFVADGLRAVELLLGRDVYLALPAAVRDAIIVMGDAPVPTTELVVRALHAPAPLPPDDEFDRDDGGLDLGEHSDIAVRAALDAALLTASAQGLSASAVARLRAAVMAPDLFDVFRVQMGPDPPADVVPTPVRFKPDAIFRRAAPRRYSAEASAFMRAHMATLERYGYVIRDNSATVASPAYPVRKAGVDPSAPVEKRMRLTVDLRAINSQTEPHLFPLPRPETFVENLGGYPFLGSVDLQSSYWQLPLHPDSQSYFCIMTDEGIWRPTRQLQGACDGTACMQSAMTDTLGDLLHVGAEVLLDDIAVKGRTEDQLVDNMIGVLHRVHARRFKVNAFKINFFSPRILLFGRVFTKDGVHFNPAFIDTVARMPSPSSASELQSFLATCNWMRQACPRYAELVGPLQQLLTDALRLCPAGSKAARDRLQLRDNGWTAAHDTCVTQLKAALVHAVMLSYPRPDSAICVFTDASDHYWSGIVTQCEPAELSKPILQQQHLPLAFFSGPFTATQSRYAMVEKEGLAMVATCTKAAHLLRRPNPIHLFTDHRNNAALYSPDISVTASTRPAADRIARWQVFMRSFDYKIHAISTDDNLVADIFTRWACTPVVPDAPSDGPPPLLHLRARRALTRAQQRAAVPGAAPAPPAAAVVPADVDDGPPGLAPLRRVPVPAPVPVLAAAAPVAPAAPAVAVPVDAAADSPYSASSILDFNIDDAPTEAELLAEQAKAAAAGPPPPGVVVQPDGSWTSATGALYVCDAAHLRLRLCIVAHQGAACHRGVQTTLHWLREYFYWPSMAADVALFVSHCLHCVRIRTGKIVPRPLLSTAFATGPNQAIALDYLFIRAAPESAAHNFTYVLTITDTYSKFCELVPCEAATSANAVNALLCWFGRFGIVHYWTTDGGSHFKNSVMSALRGLLGTDHHICAAHASWSNGRVERLQHVVLQALQALCVGACLSEDDWPSWLPLVASVINHSPSDTLGGLCPVTVHTGLPATNPVSVVFLPDARDLLNVAPSMTDIKAHVAVVAAQLTDFRDRVDAVRPRNRRPQRGEVPVDFDVGSYVLIAKHGPAAADKLRPRWSGPARVVDTVSPYVYTVEDLITSARTDVHASFIKMYADCDLTVTPQLLAFVAHSGRGYAIDSIIDHKLQPAQLLVRWEGFVDPTWEPLHTVFADTPVSVRSYARSVVDPVQRTALLALLRDLAA